MADLTSPTGWHRVCLNTIVRKGVELDSERLRILPMGSKVFVEEVQGRRVKISSPIVGWCSKKSSTMDTILEKIVQTDGGVTPRNRNQAEKLEKLKIQAQQAQDTKVQEKLSQEIADLKNVIQTKQSAQKTLEAELADLKGKMEIQLRDGDVVHLPEGRGLGVVRFVGKEQGNDSITVGVQVEIGAGTRDGSVTLEDGKPGGWQAGPNGAIFYEPKQLSWLPGEKMLAKLLQLQAEKQMVKMDPNAREKME